MNTIEATVQILLNCHENLLRKRDFLIWLAIGVGCHDGCIWHKAGSGMLQISSQLADALIFLSRWKIDTFLEIGTFNGNNTCFMVAYLKRFNPNIKVITLDIVDRKAQFYSLPIQQILKTSDSVSGQYYDLCFIDADHSLPAATKDYMNVGRHSKLCMFHDINDDYHKNPDPGRLWRSLKSTEPYNQFHEFIDGDKGLNMMGLGIRVNNGLVKLL